MHTEGSNKDQDNKTPCCPSCGSNRVGPNPWSSDAGILKTHSYEWYCRDCGKFFNSRK